ncbi:hypothetical protein ACHAWF_012289 [Thalassiosira exigua]
MATKATPTSLLSFRRSAGRVARDGRGERRSGGRSGGGRRPPRPRRDDFDDEDDGWVHGGRYVPPPSSKSKVRPPAASAGDIAAAPPPSTARSAGVPAGGTPATTPAHPFLRASDVAGPSPYSMLSPPALGTPLPLDNATGQAESASAPQVPAAAARTPSTVRLERLLRGSSPTPARPGRASFAPPAGAASSSASFAPAVAAGTPAVGRPVATDAPSFPPRGLSWAVDSLLRTLRFLWPVVPWILRTLLALFLIVSGTVVHSVVLLFRGSHGADGTSASEVRRSAVESLTASARKARDVAKDLVAATWEESHHLITSQKVPFTGFSPWVQRALRGNDAGGRDDRAAERSDGGGKHDVDVAGPTDGGRTPRPSGAIAAAGAGAAEAGSANGAGGATASSTPATAAAAASAATPATARRVLFSETARGEVRAERFHYDKDLPASARKERGGAGGSVAGGVVEGGEESDRGGGRTRGSNAGGGSARGTPPAATTPEAAILRPSKYFEAQTMDSPREGGMDVPQPNVAAMKKPAPAAGADARAARPRAQAPNEDIRAKGQPTQPRPATEEERRKRRNVEKYLDPTITPLSTRYGRMQREQGKRPWDGNQGRGPRPGQGPRPHASIADGPSAAASSPSTGGPRRRESAKRKRRGDLLAAAYRTGRARRARLDGARAATLKSAGLGKNVGGSAKRRRERADERVWRAMCGDDDDEKENVAAATETGLAKRGKFGAGGGAPSSPVPASTGAAGSIAAPPRTPGPSRTAGGMPGFSFGAAAGAETAGAGSLAKGGERAVAAKASAEVAPASFSFAGGGGGAAAVTTATTAATSTATTAPTTVENSTEKGAVPNPTFSFGTKPAPSVGGMAEANGATTAAPEFSLGAASQPAPSSKSKDATPAAPGFSFGAAPAASETTETHAASAPPAASFSFGAASQPARSSEAKEAAAPAPPAFSFGTTPAAGGSSATSAASTQPVPNAQANVSGSTAAAPSGSTFSFGAGAGAGAETGASAAQLSTFSFGAGASSGATTPAAPGVPNFAGLGAGGLGGGTGGASARRRAAKASGRRR